MKKVFIAFTALVLTTGLYSFIPAKKAADATTYTVDSKNSKIDWNGSKPGGYHTGTLSLKGGVITTENGKLTGGKFVIDLSSIKATDGAGEKLEGHLKSEGFLDVAKFGEATYEISKVNYTGEKTCDVIGTLDLKGVKAEVKFTAQVRAANEKGFFGEAFFSLDRTVFGVSYGKGMIASDVQIGVHLFGTK